MSCSCQTERLSVVPEEKEQAALHGADKDGRSQPSSLVREQKWMVAVCLVQPVSRDSPSAGAGGGTPLNGTSFPRAHKTLLVMRAAAFLPLSHKHT